MHYLSLGLHDQRCGSGSSTLLKTGQIWEKENVEKRIEDEKRWRIAETQNNAKNMMIMPEAVDFPAIHLSPHRQSALNWMT
jgi:hypothetical protein